MKHKTQVFVYHVGDHYRTRLTHSIEVSQIARSLARALRVDEDLAEALALSHDFGHTPFGHAGEDALHEVTLDIGGFDHNAQSLRIVTELERQYAEYDGLNLSWETLEGLVKHNGPMDVNTVPVAIKHFNDLFDLELHTHSCLEAQCAAIADDIAYNAHDIDDGMRAGMFELDDLLELPLIGDALRLVREQYPDLDPSRTRHEIVRRQITGMVEDVIANALTQLETLMPNSAEEVRHCGKTIVAFSKPMAEVERKIKAFLYERMYRSPDLLKSREGAARIIKELYSVYTEDEDALPKNGNDYLVEFSGSNRARAITDFIAGMTDGYAISEHKRLFDDTPQLG